MVKRAAESRSNFAILHVHQIRLIGAGSSHPGFCDGPDEQHSKTLPQVQMLLLSPDVSSSRRSSSFVQSFVISCWFKTKISKK